MLFPLLCVCLSLAADAVASDSQTKDQKRILLHDSNDSIIAKLDAMEREVAKVNALETEVATLKLQAGKVDALEKEVATLKAAHSHGTVACMAKLTTSVSGQGHHIYFDDVQLNLGNAYNPHHGTFVPPVNGTYLVSVTACSGGGHNIVLQVNVNESVLGKVFAGDRADSECNSKVLLGHLHAGDDVFVQHLTIGDYLWVDARYGNPTFSVALLQAD